MMIGRRVVSLTNRQRIETAPLRRAIAHAALRVSHEQVPVDASMPLVAFTRDWLKRSSRLIGARVAAILHSAAFTFALGAIVSLYLRGLVFEYRAGWESTFLDATSVQRLLSFVLAPASAVTGIAVPSAEHLTTIRFPETSGENAAPRLHLYAPTLMPFVRLPRA